ncbi:carbohydrate ABC transporter permease [Mesobacillus foraminis]|uniref:Multiple sugar transport system permease protein n=1 Tax=Mesobacillus foraminis TaxID=279826 RepID=A0A4R2B3L4_9BACI|nr:sugar ABC transporter permease [Mesobacillus foraminis]TCN21161.1 multiple sugar transport system permease protein [Mesobacillus foraminis]
MGIATNQQVQVSIKKPVKRRNFKLRKYKLSHICFILPALLLNLIFFVYPFIKSFIMSFYKWPIMGESTFIGLTNYLNLLKDGTFWSSLWFTAKYTLIVTPALFLVGFILALLINNRLRATSFFRSVYFMPVVISMVSCSLMWLWIYNDLYGMLNYYLLKFHIINEPIVWMGQASTSLPAISFMITWKMAGFTMVILLSGLQSISEEVYEAAKTDGASKWQQILYITIPLLKPSIGLSLVISVIGSVLAFEQFLVMTHGGPSNSTTTVVHHIYNTSFKYFNLGYGSAMTFILLVILIIFSVFQVKMMRDPAGN